MEQIIKRVKIIHVITNNNNKRKRSDDVFISTKRIMPNPQYKQTITRGPISHLIWACAMGRKDIVRKILSTSSGRMYINMVENTNRTPLMFAVIVGKERIVKKLLECQTIDVDLQDNEGRTAMDYANRFLNIPQCRTKSRLLIMAMLIDYNEKGRLAHNKLFIST